MSKKITELQNNTTIVDADLIPVVVNVATTPVTEKRTVTNLKSFFKTYFDTLYEVIGSTATHAADTSTHGVTTVAGLAETQTFTNKRNTKRTGTTTSSATPTINTDNVDEYYITAQAVNITSFTTNLSGTPVKGDHLYISIIGTADRAITWGASFGNGPAALPTTTITTTELSTFFKYDGSIWRCYATGSRV